MEGSIEMKQRANILKKVCALENGSDGVVLSTVAVWELTALLKRAYSFVTILVVMFLVFTVIYAYILTFLFVFIVTFLKHKEPF